MFVIVVAACVILRNGTGSWKYRVTCIIDKKRLLGRVTPEDKSDDVLLLLSIVIETMFHKHIKP